MEKKDSVMTHINCPLPANGPTGLSNTWQCPDVNCRKWYEWNTIVKRWYRREAWEVK